MSYHMKTPERKEYFRQEGPKPQQVCTLMGLEGQISNLEDGIPPSTKSIENLKLLLRHLKELTPYLPDKW